MADSPMFSKPGLSRQKKHATGLILAARKWMRVKSGEPAGTPIFENEEEEDYIQLIYSVAEKMEE